MSEARSVRDVAAAIFTALQARDLAALAELQHEDVVDDFVAIGVYRGRAQVAAFFTEMFAAVPDLNFAVEALSGDGEHATVRWRFTGTFSGEPFQGIHATGRSIDLRGVDVMHIVDGRLKDNTIYYDGLAFVRQIGLLPREGSAGDRALTAAFNAQTDVRARLRRRP